MFKNILPALMLLRAQTVVGTGVRYSLGTGGRNPLADSPARNGTCDCSGFVSWAFGLDRRNSAYDTNGGWISTDSIYRDITQSLGLLFTEIDERRSGSVLVYPDNSNGEGHMAIIVSDHRIVHCSLGNYRSFNDAIQVTDDAVFSGNRTRIAWYKAFD